MNGLKRYARGARALVSDPRTGLEVIRPKRYIFIQSHMRSYSSLLCHILNSNPEVAGYVETHRSYKGTSDLWRLKQTVFDTAAAETGGRYVLDKVLHNRSTIDPVLLRRDNVYVVFSLREPIRTVQSTVAMARSLDPDDWKVDPLRVVRYYIKRVDHLRRLALLEYSHATYIDAQDLIDDTPRVLSELTAFLDLSEPLREEYQTSKLTGVPTYGDPSEYIKSGNIVRTRQDYSDIEVPAAELAEAVEAYERAAEVLGELRSGPLEPAS